MNINARKFTTRRFSTIAPDQMFTILSTCGTTILLTVMGVGYYHLDSKLEADFARFDSKFDSNAAQYESLRSEILNAIANAHGERVRALEVAATRKK